MENDKRDMNDNILVVKHLKKYYPVSRFSLKKEKVFVKAVDDVSFSIRRGTTMGLVGESGCGKTTIGRTILRLHNVTDGQVLFDNIDLATVQPKKLRKMRPQMQMIFQDPYSSLSPRLPIGEIIGEAVKEHHIIPKSEYRAYIMKVMRDCGLQPQYFYRYPHEFSGGQRQRISIARAVALKPKFIICDEPVSALDVSIQSQIINLMKDLQEQFGYTYLFISHDLSVVEHISDTIGVMYLGSMVETGDKKSVFANPLHPYTKALLSAVPVSDPDVKMNRIILKGDIPSPMNPPSGCRFRTRCQSCMKICEEKVPALKEVEKDHMVACHLYGEQQ
ncbi:MAG: dipeptide ABC transporter ATP-binding protein [Thermoclostridium sp.]|nr:dipeptide ABC transporter ATP-binding protein [Thermoclostridium sp.]